MEKQKIKKNVKISDKHHDILKSYCNKKGLKMHRLIEKWIDENCKIKPDIYGED